MTDKLDARALEGMTDEELEALKEDDEGTESEEEAGDDAGEELRRDPTPLLDTRVPEDLPERLAALDEEKAELVSRFDDGELTAREYSDRLQAIADKRSDVEWMRRKADFAKEAHETAITKNWENAVSKFMTTTGKDITAKGEAALLAFDSYVKRVTSDPSNSRLSDRAQLAKAHKAFRADFGKLPAARSHSAYDAEPGSAADHARDSADFARLDRLADSDPIAYEKAIERMSPEEADKYLKL